MIFAWKNYWLLAQISMTAAAVTAISFLQQTVQNPSKDKSP
jgi:hypothetical protein